MVFCMNENGHTQEIKRKNSCMDLNNKMLETTKDKPNSNSQYKHFHYLAWEGLLGSILPNDSHNIFSGFGTCTFGPELTH